VPLANRIFHCSCRKCNVTFDFKGSYEQFNEFLGRKCYTCAGGHSEDRSPMHFIKLDGVSNPIPSKHWVPSKGKNYVDILDDELTEIKMMQLDHIGSGIYIDRRTGKKYDYEADMKGKRHYYEVTATPPVA